MGTNCIIASPLNYKQLRRVGIDSHQDLINWRLLGGSKTVTKSPDNLGQSFLCALGF